MLGSLGDPKAIQLFESVCVRLRKPKNRESCIYKGANKLVPDHWQLINDRDAVPRAAKFYVLYKRAGHRVLLNQVQSFLFSSCFVACIKDALTAIVPACASSSVCAH